MTVALVERKLFGGTCVNTGCMPTKTLVASAHAAHVARRARDFGVMIDGHVRVDMARVKARADAVVDECTDRHREVAARSDRLHGDRGSRPLRDPRHGARRRRAFSRAPRIFINVGGRAVVPDLPGVGSVPFLTNTSMLAPRHVPEHLVVVGGSYVGLEFAQMYRRFGAEVTVVEKAPRLIAREDRRRLGGDAGDSRARGHRRAHAAPKCIRSRAARAGRRRAASTAPRGPPEVVGSHVLLAVGRRPNTDDLGLDGAGVAPMRAATSSSTTASPPTSRDLGARRLQRARRVHAYGVQRLRDRRGEPARRRDRKVSAAFRLRPLHGSPLGRAGSRRSRLEPGAPDGRS